jgi:methylenetetrahydrofolate reductase (NADPH)
MKPISIELVPRSVESLTEDLRVLRDQFPSIEMVNIPDLLRFDVRSWDACQLAQMTQPRTIPHIRAMDFSQKNAEGLCAKLTERGLDEILVVRGDPPQDMSRRVHPTTAADLIRSIKQIAPNIRCHAALDPYRAGMQTELDGVREKLEAGAVGFFSQPLFDLRYMEIWRDQLPGVEVYWGLSPVVRESTRRYWEVKNRAFFPGSFEPTLQWNRAFAQTCIDWARENDEGLYFMPIRVDIAAYLEGLV